MQLDPWDLVGLHVDRHLDLLEQRADALEANHPAIVPPRMVGVEVGSRKDADEAHAVGVHDAEEVLHGVGGVHETASP